MKKANQGKDILLPPNEVDDPDEDEDEDEVPLKCSVKN